MTDVSYVPGNRTAIVADPCWALVDATPDAPAVTDIWQRIRRAPRLDALLAELLRDGFDRVPDFALLVAAEGGRHHLICRGGASATLAGAQGSSSGGPAPRRVTGAGLVTWLECAVDAAVGCVVLGDPPADTALRLPAAAGVLLAASVVVDLAAAGPRSVTIPVPVPVPVPAAVPVAAPYPDTITITHPSTSIAYPQARPAAPARPADPAVPVAPAPLAEELSYDFLFGATQMRTVEDAAVRSAQDGDGGVPFGLPPAAIPPFPAAPIPDMPPAARPAQPQAHGGPLPPGGLIDAVPWGADDGSTVVRADVLKLAAAPPPDRIGPVVHALLCPDSHLNPPSSATCRRCGVPLPHQDPVTVPRPVLGVLRLSAGDVITLDRGVVMGRSPRADFTGADGEERPHIVKLPSGDGDISRTHLRVSLDGWHVLVTDLNSTNGTLVTLPGRDPEHIRPGAPVPIQPGTVVTLADGIDFRYEVTE